MTLGLILLFLGIGIAVGIPTLLLLGYLLGRLRPVYHWRLRRVYPTSLAAARTLGLPTGHISSWKEVEEQAREAAESAQHRERQQR